MMRVRLRAFPGCRTTWRLIGICAVIILLAGAWPVESVTAQGSDGTTTHYVSWGETLFSIALRYGVTVQAIMDANGLSDPDRIYVGQRLIIPGTSVGLLSSPPQTIHIVQPGENLYRIGLQYGFTIDQLLAANNLTNPDQVYAGQALIIPDGSVPPSMSPTVTGNVHIVQAGETLYGISLRYGLSVTALAATNHLLNPSQIYVGQVLILPGAATATGMGYTPDDVAFTHVVQAGETLFSIASRYGVPTWVLTQVNNISNPSLLYAGQVLTIPSNSALYSGLPGTSSSNKAIIVDISDQRVYVYENGQLIWTFVASTGIAGRETARGNFYIQNKLPMAYAATWNLQMPYWLGFYWAGPLQNGFHALPILSNGQRLWEGLLGSPASYGCVILSDHDARLLYDWAEVGVPVTVRD
jgi:LysM repeat protein